MSGTATDDEIKVIIAYAQAALERLGPRRSAEKALPEGMILLGEEVLHLRQHVKQLQAGLDFESVGEFHQKFGLRNVNDSVPQARALSREELDFRMKFIAEEFEEYAEACGIDLHVDIDRNILAQKGYDPDIVDLPKAADALVDMVYVILGTAHLHQLPWHELFAEVQRANMSKERCGIDHVYEACGENDCEICSNGPICHHETPNTGTLNDVCQQPRAAHSLRGSALDVIKPVGWRPPDIAGVLARFGWKCCERDTNGDGNCDRHPVKK